MKCLLGPLLSFVSIVQPIHSTVVKTTEIEEVLRNADATTLVLFNIAEVLIDTEISLGSQAWRKNLRSRTSPEIHDALTYYVFQHVPPKPVESATPELVRKLQSLNVPTLAFTSRGRTEWYSTQINGVDEATEEVLSKVGLNFCLPSQLAKLESDFPLYFHNGIIYATNKVDKGELLSKIFQITGYQPSKVIFVDDKADSLVSVQKAMSRLGIEFLGLHYTRTAEDHLHYDQMVADIQLDRLLLDGKILSDEEALRLKETEYSTVEEDVFFNALIQKWINL